MRRKRPLTPEEERLWRQAMRDTAPLSPGQKAGRPEDPQSRSGSHGPEKPHLRQPQRPTHAPSPRTPSPPRAHPTPPPLHHIDRKSAQKVRRGRIEVDSKVDLHGLRQAQAHDTLVRRLMSAQSRGHRVVLVVTGKGRSENDRPWGSETRDDPFTGRGGGVLKAQAPLWLSQEPLRSIIHSVQEAHPKHGGSGALYVFLKRTRGPI